MTPCVAAAPPVSSLPLADTHLPKSARRSRPEKNSAFSPADTRRRTPRIASIRHPLPSPHAGHGGDRHQKFDSFKLKLKKAAMLRSSR